MSKIEDAIYQLDDRVTWLDENLDLGFTEKWMDELLVLKDEIKEAREEFIILKNIKDALQKKAGKLSNVMDLFYKIEAYDDLDIERCYEEYEKEKAAKKGENDGEVN